MTSGVRVIYDGQCPLCTCFVQLYRLREAAGSIELVDARLYPELVAALARDGYDLNQGMLVEIGEVRAHGAQAMHLLALLSSANTGFNKANAWLFRRKHIANLAYPVLRAGRQALLKLMGRQPIGEHH
jgi:predicted DCC family thiol-disulfide oxidoreductase YuxK